MSTFSLTLHGDSFDDLRDATIATFEALAGDDISVKALTDMLKMKLPSMNVTLTPKGAKPEAPAAEAAPAEAPKTRGRPKKAETAAPVTEDPFATPAAPAAQSPAEARAAAMDLLMAAYNDKAKQGSVIALLKKYGIKKFAEVGDDKAAELLADAKAI